MSRPLKVSLGVGDAEHGLQGHGRIAIRITVDIDLPASLLPSQFPNTVDFFWFRLSLGALGKEESTRARERRSRRGHRRKDLYYTTNPRRNLVGQGGRFFHIGLGSRIFSDPFQIQFSSLRNGFKRSPSTIDWGGSRPGSPRLWHSHPTWPRTQPAASSCAVRPSPSPVSVLVPPRVFRSCS